MPADFLFERDVEDVRRAARQMEVAYPIAVDSSDFCVSQASQISLAGDKAALVVSVEIGGID